MWLYLSIFALPASWWAAEKAWHRLPRALVLGSALLLLLAIGLRREVGGDWHSYWLMYERARSYPAGTAFFVSDPGYMALNVAAARAGLNLAFANLACAALLVAGTVAFARLQPRPWLALLAATPVLLIVVGMTATRQSAAIGLELLALAAFRHNRPGAASAALILGWTFHWSAAALLPLVPLMFAPERLRRPLMLGAALLALAAAAALWLSHEARSIHPPAAGAGFRLLPSLVALALLLSLRKRMSWGAGEAMVAAYLAGLTLFCLALWPASSVAADRFGLYSIPLQMMVLPALRDALPVRWRGSAEAAAAAMYAGLFAGWALLGSHTASVLPYRSYLEAPASLFAPEPLPLTR